MQESIDRLIPERGLIQLSKSSEVDFDVENYILKRLHGDVILAEYIDLAEDGESITRGGIVIPLNAQTKAWRKAQIILAGEGGDWCQPGEIVIFPHNYGVEVGGIEVAGYGKLEHGVFINESRVFGVCEKKG